MNEFLSKKEKKISKCKIWKFPLEQITLTSLAVTAANRLSHSATPQIVPTLVDDAENVISARERQATIGPE